MRIPAFNRYRRFLSGFCLLIAGAIIGSSIYMSIHQRNFNILYIKMHNYQTENKQLQQDLESIRKTRNKQTLVNGINVYLQNQENAEPLSEDIQKEIEALIKKELELAIGQKATNVRDSRVLYERLISQKILTIHEKKYTVEVKSMVLIQTELSVWITAKEKRI
ncbi:hypothetical protein [Paenibacillus eucommiae]|uniref:Sporulation membrane protein YtrI C-terminal domain-containing protein n=1 Tax=Paenibacillus eucommiae TaxID=1355755 RepID=A0ABS4J097_9BACL|nr:hypothetical protein [Paenibacillus eucommiae]MBP1993264.1 hypothetical protein [Paenibacillus eucommiae]